MKKITIFGLSLLLIALSLSAWSWPSPDWRKHWPKPTPTVTKTRIPTRVPTKIPTATPTRIPTIVPTSTPIPSFVFADEFNGTSIDTSLWHNCSFSDQANTGTDCTSYNNQLETFTATNVQVHDGTLDLVAKNEGGKYTSGKVISKKTFLYGHIEARVNIPYGKGYWPAFWLLYASGSYKEVDIMETINNDHTDYMTFWYNSSQSVSGSAPITEGWHTLALDWQKDKLVWSIDGIAKFSVSDASKIPSNPMYIILNLAIGGDWPGSPNSSTVFPAHFLIDYVHVSQ
jgi:beta-glucanase (GH16 family)